MVITSIGHLTLDLPSVWEYTATLLGTMSVFDIFSNFVGNDVLYRLAYLLPRDL